MLMTSDGNYPLSALATIFPPMSPSEFQEMIQSVRERGLQKPITRWQGQIIDGRHRYEACLHAGVAPRFHELPDDADPLDHVLDENATRRHMTESQRAIAAHRLWEESSSEWTALRLPGESANLHTFTRQEAANRFNVSRRLAAHAGKVVGRDTQAIPELRLAAEQGIVAVSDASKAAVQAPDIQLRALELVQGGRSRTIGAAVKEVLQEIRDQQLEESPGEITPEQLSAGIALHRSTVGDLHGLVDRESIDAIITFPPTSGESLAMLPDLASFAAHALKPSGVMVVLASGELLPDVLDHLKHPELRWVCEFDYIFGEPAIRLRGKHPLELRRRPLLVFGKARFRLGKGHDVIRLPRPDDSARPTQRLEAGMRLIVQRFTRPGQVVCDPIMLDRAGVGLAALEGGCRFVGAERDQSCVDRVSRRLAEAGMADPSSGQEKQGVQTALES